MSGFDPVSTALGDRQPVAWGILTAVLLVGTLALVGVASAAPATSPGSAEAVSQPLAPVADRPWMQEVDRLFGEWLVRPLKAVLFFDFGTGKWLGEKRSIPFVVAWLFIAAVYFTFRMNFISVRAFWHAVRLTKGDYDNPHDTGEVSHFQAIASALSGTLGLGNIAGVAIAIGQGGRAQSSG